MGDDIMDAEYEKEVFGLPSTGGERNRTLEIAQTILEAQAQLLEQEKAAQAMQQNMIYRPRDWNF